MTAATDVQFAVDVPTGTRQFPADPSSDETTVLVVLFDGDALPIVVAAGTAGELDGDPDGVSAAAGELGTALLPEHWTGLTTRPGLRGHRLGGAEVAAAGRDWSTRFRLTTVVENDDTMTVTAVDETAGLAVATEVESLVGGAVRIRHTLTNMGESPYVVDGLDVVLPCSDRHDEVLDFSGRHERERFPQRHTVTDGLWLREGRQGRPGLDASTLLVTGPAGFGFDADSLLAVHVAWSGNHLLRVERSGVTGTTIGGGEHLLPGEVVLATGESYRSPWVFVAATTQGLDGIAAALHGWQRSLPAHPAPVPVTLQRLGGGLLRPRPGPTQGDRRPRGRDRRRAIRVGRRLVSPAAERFRRARRLVGRPSCLARGPEPADRPRRVPRHGVRAVVRTRDGQPGLGPVPHTSGLGAGHR